MGAFAVIEMTILQRAVFQNPNRKGRRSLLSRYHDSSANNDKRKFYYEVSSAGPTNTLLSERNHFSKGILISWLFQGTAYFSGYSSDVWTRDPFCPNRMRRYPTTIIPLTIMRPAMAMNSIAAK